MRLRSKFKNALNEKIARLFFKLMPNIVSVIAGKMWFSRYIKNDSKIKFIGNVYKTKFKLLTHGSNNVEKEAASNFIAPDNAVLAISKVNLDNSVVIDIGANVGTVSIFMISQLAKKIFSFEPGPLYKDLIENLALNNLNKKINAIQLGLSD